jgi:hypothetical protein
MFSLECRKFRHYSISGSKKDTEMAATTLAPPAPAVSTFPVAAVETCLRDELLEAIKAEASIRGLSLPASPAQMVKTAVPIDSLVVVSILCAVEPIVGFELPESLVRAGGYVSVESALGHLLSRIEAQWNKRKGAKP